MKRKARYFALALALLLTLAMVAGCSCSTDGTGAPTPSSGAAGQPSASAGAQTQGSQPAGGKTQLQFLTWANAPTVNFMKALGEKFTAENPDIEFVVSDVPQSEHTQVMQTRVAANDVDIVSFQQFSKPQEDWNKVSLDMPDWQKYIEEGLLLDLTDQEFLKQYNKTALDDNAYNGKYYQVPTGTVAYNGLFYNKAIFEEFNLSEPQTWDEFIALCDTIKNSGKYSVITCGAADQWPLNMFSTGIMTNWLGEEGTQYGKDLFLGNVKHTDEVSMEIYKAMDQFASYMEPGVTGVTYSDVPGRFAQGNIAMLADGSWQAPTIAEANPDLKFGYFPLPGKEKRADGLPTQFGIKYDLALCVVATSPKVEQALKFLEFFSQKQNYTDFLNAVGGFTPTQPDVTLDNDFLNSLATGLQKPYINMEHKMYAPKGVGEYGGNSGFSFFYFKSLGGPLSVEELAQLAGEDFETARKAAESLQ